MNHYCTYFDRTYLAQGVALWQSLTRNDARFRLTVLALDDETARGLRSFADDRLEIVGLAELLAHDPALARVQATRSRSEFIFSLTPCFIAYVLATRNGIERIAYLDADLFFFASTAAIWDELGRGSVLIVPHRYPPWHDDSPWYGRFNVGVVGFRRDDAGQACLASWREDCLSSTALTGDGDHYGDQKYLDAWPERFRNVIVSTHAGINVAPWNWAGHRFDLSERGVRVGGEPLVVFHFAQFKRVSEQWFDSGQLEYGVMPRRLRERIYGEYWAALREAESLIRIHLPEYRLPRRGWRASLGRWHLAVLRVFWGQFWWHREGQWIATGVGVGRWSGRAMALYRGWRRRK